MKDQVYKVSDELKASLTKLVGEATTTEAIKNEVSLATQKCLHNLNAQIHGGEVTSCGTMWERFSWKQKCRWFVVNKLVPSIGTKARDLDRDARTAWYENRDPDDDDYFPLTIDPLFEYSPKSVIQTDVSMRLVQTVEFIGVKVQLDKLESEK